MSRRRSRPRYILAVLALAAITLVTLDARGTGSPVLDRVRSDAHGALATLQSDIHDALRPVGDFLTGALEYGSLRTENARLRLEVEAAQSAEAKAVFDQRAADQVLRADGVPFADQYRTVVAQVIDQPSSNFEETVTIDRGTSSGVAVGQPVITPAGLAGQVSSVGRRSSTITLLSDPRLVVGVALPGGNVGSAVSFGPGRDLNVTVIATAKADPAVRRGQMLYTSATGQVFPPGIPVGAVASVTHPAAGGEPAITVRPVADTSDLSYLTVVMWLPQ